MTAAALPFTPSFCITLEIWFLTVFSLIFNLLDISFVVLFSINKLNISQAGLELIKNSLNNSGVILICGASLTGKTHLIYSILFQPVLNPA